MFEPQICQYIKYEKSPVRTLVIKENTASNLKLFYVLSGNLSVYIHGHVHLSLSETLDLINFETLYQLGKVLRVCEFPADRARRLISLLWVCSEHSRHGQTSAFSVYFEQLAKEGLDRPVALKVNTSLLASESQLTKYFQFSLLDRVVQGDLQSASELQVDLSSFPDVHGLNSDRRSELQDMDSYRSSKNMYGVSGFHEVTAAIQSKANFALGLLPGAERLLPNVIKKLLGQMVRVLSTGDIFGERALEGKNIRTASIVCDSDCE